MIDYEKLGRLDGEELESYLNGLVKYWEDKVQETKELIAKHKLTQPEPKYRVNQLMWLQSDDEIYSFVIERIEWDGSDYICSGGAWDVCEISLFPTRQALIEHQIEYWQSLQADQRDVEQMLYDESKKLWLSNTQSNQPQINVDRRQYPTITEKCENYNKSKLEFIDNVNLDQCEHEGSPIEFYNKRPVTWKCLKCGECYK